MDRLQSNSDDYNKGYNNARRVVLLDPLCFYDLVEHEYGELGICSVMSKFYHCKESCVRNEHHNDDKGEAISWYAISEEIRGNAYHNCALSKCDGTDKAHSRLSDVMIGGYRKAIVSSILSCPHNIEDCQHCTDLKEILDMEEA